MMYPGKIEKINVIIDINDIGIFDFPREVINFYFLFLFI